jgi:hypothetical protein
LCSEGDVDELAGSREARGGRRKDEEDPAG